jgi:hypothetical protein
LDAAISPFARNPKRQLMEGTRAYVEFAVNNTDTFKIMFSGVLEKEKAYPAFVEISRKTFDKVVDVVRACQTAGILRAGSPEVLAVSVWGQVHGIVSLALEGQISHTVLRSHSLPEIVSLAIDQLTLS